MVFITLNGSNHYLWFSCINITLVKTISIPIFLNIKNTHCITLKSLLNNHNRYKLTHSNEGTNLKIPKYETLSWSQLKKQRKSIFLPRKLNLHLYWKKNSVGVHFINLFVGKFLKKKHHIVGGLNRCCLVSSIVSLKFYWCVYVYTESFCLATCILCRNREYFLVSKLSAVH